MTPIFVWTAYLRLRQSARHLAALQLSCLGTQSKRDADNSCTGQACVWRCVLTAADPLHVTMVLCTMSANTIWSEFFIFLVQAAVFRRKAGEVQGRGQIRAPGGPVSKIPFGRLVGDIDSSGEPQVSPCPITHLVRQSPTNCCIAACH